MPNLVPDHVSLWGLLIKIRRELQQSINVRPAKLLKGYHHLYDNQMISILLL